MFDTALLHDARKAARALVGNRNVAAFLFWLVCFYWNSVLQAYSEAIAQGDHPSPPAAVAILDDIGFRVVPRLHWDAVADIWVYALVFGTIARYMVTPALRWMVFRRHALLLGALFFVRGFALVMTTLPNPQTTCVATAVGRSPWVEAVYILLTRHKTCADMFFSGHAVNATIAGLIWHHYSHRAPLLNWDPLGRWLRAGPVASAVGDIQRATTVKLLVWYAVAVEFYLIIATRLHYTIDVFTGFALTVLAFKLYHHYLRTAHTRDNLFNRVLCWFEQDSEDVIAWRQATLALAAAANVVPPKQSPTPSPILEKAIIVDIAGNLSVTQQGSV
jgi:hypothetical protein